MTHYLDKEAYKDRMRRNGAHSRGGIGKERKAALARATEKPLNLLTEELSHAEEKT